VLTTNLASFINLAAGASAGYLASFDTSTSPTRTSPGPRTSYLSCNCSAKSSAHSSATSTTTASSASPT
jgi:hypothetical protein